VRVIAQTAVMKRTYRDILTWLAGIRPPNNDLPAERAIAAVICNVGGIRSGPQIGCALGRAVRSSPNEHFFVRHQRDVPQGFANLFRGLKKPARSPRA
jgi:hypothetical protein